MHVFDKYSGERLGEVREASAADVHRAVTRASVTAPAWGAVAAHKRSTILRRTAELLESKREALAELIARESGKAWRYADAEVARAVETFEFASEEAKRLHGETVPLDASAAGEGRVGFYLRVPVGVVAAITPFNFPLNLVAHKVAPALAAGNTVVLKPSDTTPLATLKLAEQERRERRLARRLEDDRAPGGKRGSDLVRDQVEREVERRDGADDPDRHPHRVGDLADTGGRRVHRDDVAGKPARFDGGHRVRGDGALGLDACGLQRLAGLCGDRLRDLVVALFQERGDAVENGGALVRRERRAHGVLRGIESLPRVLGARSRDAGHSLAGVRRIHVLPVAGLDPLTVEEELPLLNRHSHRRPIQPLRCGAWRPRFSGSAWSGSGRWARASHRSASRPASRPSGAK